VLANGKRGTSAYRVADTGGRRGLPGEKAKEENQRQGNVELQKKGSSLLFMEVMTRPHTVGTVPNCPALSVPSMRHLAKLETKSNCNDFILMFENKSNSFARVNWEGVSFHLGFFSSSPPTFSLSLSLSLSPWEESLPQSHTES